ncbi:proline--tRNA ligase [Caproicibacterium sp. BJN0003]|uniref:proline--tRNA ligase n=1 Tax=Caproicibacterium sp. BJN0003 TaxID=2994078 RepID=UPI00224F4456|nr:proline--tRNA ligase [Caproicibacterium sp. BJN0003]UZT81836.1 proline--tRNA ligase [Caproicibacterium sp. BJN0003]
MADKKFVEAITPMDEDFTRWYTDIVKKAELMDYSSVKGCMVIEPYGYAIWENIQKILDKRFKELGHENVYMPMFIPESLLNKEKEHVKGFAPEVAWVTQGGGEKLEERLCVRPTSEVLFCEHYQKVIHSWRDLPKLYNQWCSVVRWEKTTRPFLRSSEFLWQEGHTMHETPEEAKEETMRMLHCYEDFYRDSLAIPAVTGQKTEKEKFAGAEATYTIEPMMHNGVALQGGTSHYFGDGFAKSFGITFTGRDNTLQHPYQTSWGVSTRMIGAIIMVHGDDSGLKLPPAIAPIQVVIVPVAQHKPGVLEKANALFEELKKAGVRVKLDDSEQSPGWKFAQYEMKGVPLRLEIGPKDIEKDQCVLVRRTDREKIFTPLGTLLESVNEQLQKVHDQMYEQALANLNAKTFVAHNHEEFLEIAKNKPGFIKAMWCGDAACEEKLKDETGGVKSRCIPFEEEHVADTCVCCGKPATHMVYWGRQY